MIAEDDEGEWPESEESPVAHEEPVQSLIDISLSSVMGFSNPKTMKMKGEICGMEVIILIDPGATNNFISTHNVHKLQLTYSNHIQFGVTFGNGEKIHGEGECKQLFIEVQEFTI